MFSVRKAEINVVKFLSADVLSQHLFAIFGRERNVEYCAPPIHVKIVEQPDEHFMVLDIQLNYGNTMSDLNIEQPRLVPKRSNRAKKTRTVWQAYEQSRYLSREAAW